MEQASEDTDPEQVGDQVECMPGTSGFELITLHAFVGRAKGLDRPALAPSILSGETRAGGTGCDARARRRLSGRLPSKRA